MQAVTWLDSKGSITRTQGWNFSTLLVPELCWDQPLFDNRVKAPRVWSWLLLSSSANPKMCRALCVCLQCAFVAYCYAKLYLYIVSKVKCLLRISDQSVVSNGYWKLYLLLSKSNYILSLHSQFRTQRNMNYSIHVIPPNLPFIFM